MNSNTFELQFKKHERLAHPEIRNHGCKEDLKPSLYDLNYLVEIVISPSRVLVTVTSDNHANVQLISAIIIKVIKQNIRLNYANFEQNL